MAESGKASPSPHLNDDPFKLRSYLDAANQQQQKRSRKVSDFYSRQRQLILDLLDDEPSTLPSDDNRLLKLKIAIYGSAFANIILFALQLVASISSGSLALLATCADAFVDIASSTLLVLVHRAQQLNNPFKYPIGRSKLESTGILIFSTLMAILSIQLIIESIKKIISFQSSMQNCNTPPPSSSSDNTLNLTPLSITCICLAIGVKLALGIYCFSLRQFSSARVLARDHLNDILLNTFGIVFSVLGQQIVWWIDPMGAILLALFLFTSWLQVASQNVKQAVGRSADPAFLQKLTYTAVTHDPRILQIDTCRAYHFGTRYFVEIDIVLPASMTLMEAHDIGESLQKRLETMDLVERAFVHLDYESTHKPEH